MPACLDRHLPSGEYGWVLPAGAGAVRCAMVRSREPCAGLFSASVALGSDVAEPTLLDAANLSSAVSDPGATTAVSSVPLSGSDSPKS